jgi:AraC family transcriptional regulator, regulatory protein of adaptative response / methylated-DNA-[protein]-cysteine methyltransferase
VTAAPREPELAGGRRPPAASEREVIAYGFGRTSITALLVALSSSGVVAIMIRERPGDDAFVAALRARFPRAELRRDDAATRKAIEAVVDFVERPRANIDLPLDIRGTDFQRRVWDAALAVPFGETTTFAKVAREAGSQRAVRAVGNACTQNPLEFAIPCHRVLRSDGSWSGGSPWGDQRQAAIVGREAARSSRGASKTATKGGRR